MLPLSVNTQDEIQSKKPVFLIKKTDLTFLQMTINQLTKEVFVR
jgi:hypothetical protein